jgi:hypothetical protein
MEYQSRLFIKLRRYVEAFTFIKYKNLTRTRLITSYLEFLATLAKKNIEEEELELIAPVRSDKITGFYFLFKKVVCKKVFFKALLNKFMFAGRFYLVETLFNQFFFKKRSNAFHIFFYEALNILKPFVNIHIYTFKKRGKKRSIRKGKRVVKHTKVLPIKIKSRKAYRMAMK